jgi:phage gp36-like protein
MAITVAQLRARIDELILIQLTDPNGVAVNDVMLTNALVDAAGQMEGYLYKLSAADRPPVATLDAYQVALALYNLAGNRPGAEFDSIRSRAKDAFSFLDGLKQQDRTTLDVAIDSPAPQFGADDLDLYQGKASS